MGAELPLGTTCMHAQSSSDSHGEHNGPVSRAHRYNASTEVVAGVVVPGVRFALMWVQCGADDEGKRLRGTNG